MVKVIDENGKVHWVSKEALHQGPGNVSSGERHIHLHFHIHGLESLLAGAEGSKHPSTKTGSRGRGGGGGKSAPGYGYDLGYGYGMGYGYDAGYGRSVSPRKKRSSKKTTKRVKPKRR